MLDDNIKIAANDQEIVIDRPNALLIFNGDISLSLIRYEDVPNSLTSIAKIIIDEAIAKVPSSSGVKSRAYKTTAKKFTSLLSNSEEPDM